MQVATTVHAANNTAFEVRNTRHTSCTSTLRSVHHSNRALSANPTHVFQLRTSAPRSRRHRQVEQIAEFIEQGVGFGRRGCAALPMPRELVTHIAGPGDGGVTAIEQ